MPVILQSPDGYYNHQGWKAKPSTHQVVEESIKLAKIVRIKDISWQKGLQRG